MQAVETEVSTTDAALSTAFSSSSFPVEVTDRYMTSAFVREWSSESAARLVGPPQNHPHIS
eukprot:12911682-Prorocentrum_lima.AAC.1